MIPGGFRTNLRDLLRAETAENQEALQTDQVMGINDIMTDAVAQKFLSAPPTPDQLNELIQIQK